MAFFISRMARGQQKIQSQAKAAEKAAKVKKQQGHSANDQKKAAQKALVHVCSVCKVNIFVIFWFIFLLIETGSYNVYKFDLQAQMPDPKTYKQHFENKHPKNELPDDLKNIWGYELLWSGHWMGSAEKNCCNWQSDIVQHSPDHCIVSGNKLNLVSVLTDLSRT